MQRKGGRRELDETDRRLCELLGADPRSSNRALAQAIGITDETVAARLRRLREQGILATTVIVDWEAAGYGAQAMVRVRATGTSFRQLVAGLLDHPATLAATDTAGVCDGVLTVIGASLDELHTFVTEELLVRPGATGVIVDLVVDHLKVPPAILTLPVPPWDPLELPAPIIELDELDHSLIRELAHDAHQSNSELSRRLGVSDATVRRRIQRLEDSGLVTVVAAFDPVATGDLAAVAMAFCEINGSTTSLAEAIAHDPMVLAGYRCLGGCTAIFLLGARSDAELQDYVGTGFRELPGLQSANFAITNEVLAHRGHLTRVRSPFEKP